MGFKMTKQKPNKAITRTDDKGIAEFGTLKKVTAIGDSGHILVPKGLIGKMVEVYYLREDVKKEREKND